MNSSNFSINHLLNSTEDKQLVVVNNISQGSPKTTSTNSPSSSSSKSDLSSPNSSTTSPSQPKKRLLWKFLLELLDSESGNGIVQWTDREEREFVIINGEELAQKWGEATENPVMTYESLARSLRGYYKKNVLEKKFGRNRTYRFVKGQRRQNPKNRTIKMENQNSLMEMKSHQVLVEDRAQRRQLQDLTSTLPLTPTTSSAMYPPITPPASFHNRMFVPPFHSFLAPPLLLNQTQYCQSIYNYMSFFNQAMARKH